MNVKLMRRLVALVPLLVLLAAAGALAQTKITTPKEFLGFDAGDDYVLANYTQLKAYWEKLAQESDRMKLVDIGKTAEGRPMVMAIFTSAENQKNLARYKEISQKLARAEGLTDDQARKLASEGKAVVWIDGGLHATECVPAQHLFQTGVGNPGAFALEAARILKAIGAKPRRTIRVALWGGEEQGLFGSDEYADYCRTNGENVVATVTAAPPAKPFSGAVNRNSRPARPRVSLSCSKPKRSSLPVRRL